MAHLTTTSGAEDHARALLAMVAWHTGDAAMLDDVMDEIAADPNPAASSAVWFAALAQTAVIMDLSDDPARLEQLLREKIAELRRRAAGNGQPSS